MRFDRPGNRVPYLPLMSTFAAAKARNTQEHLAWTADPAAWAKELGEGFLASVDGLARHYATEARRAVSMNGETSAPGTEPSVPSEKTALSRRITRRVARSGGIKVPDAPNSATTFVGFELSPLRTENAARWLEIESASLPSGASDATAGNPFRIDLVGLAPDGVLTIQELKVHEDSDPPVAFVQLLLYAATLAPREQMERLRHFYPRIGPQTEPVTLRLQLIVAGRARSENSERRPLWTTAPALIGALMEREEIRTHVLSLEALRVPEAMGDDGPIVGEPLHWEA